MILKISFPDSLMTRGRIVFLDCLFPENIDYPLRTNFLADSWTDLLPLSGHWWVNDHLLFNIWSFSCRSFSFSGCNTDCLYCIVQICSLTSYNGCNTDCLYCIVQICSLTSYNGCNTDCLYCIVQICSLTSYNGCDVCCYGWYCGDDLFVFCIQWCLPLLCFIQTEADSNSAKWPSSHQLLRTFGHEK